MVRPAFGFASLALTASSAGAASNYNIVDVFDSTNFSNVFTSFTQPDPTHGFVKYVDAATASRDGLAGFAQGGVYLGVDYTNITTTGRPSVRVTSRTSYTKGLFIADIAHMPAGAGGSGSQISNSVTLHTGPGCSVTNAGSLPGTKLSPNCQGNEGCTQHNPGVSNNYGAGFNAAGGGVYALEWTDASIKVWFFSRGSPLATQLSSTTTNNNNSPPSPNPSTFGTPLAAFVGSPSSCPLAKHFANHNLVLNTAFCGDWAGRVWAADQTCAALAARCEDFVGAHPEAFTQAYWLVNTIRVYQVAGSSGVEIAAREEESQGGAARTSMGRRDVAGRKEGVVEARRRWA
ncbi:glycoside hydrolase family 16 protein [Parathielavia appendiculata]|uniref:Glycoside hydrolase family 16 protein n=1 Tax=Parathielavia appendiculata TaxID=2587402 RepID=A0AAN6U847_9PEZI|nr:glycoside hydrolase family 16 protein [Parathielavia appendiculata]